MNLNKLAAALAARADGLNIDDPFPVSWCGSTTFEIHIADRLGNGREVTVRSDGTASWMNGCAPRGARSIQLSNSPICAAETVTNLVYGS